MALADLIPAENRSPGLTASELERAQEEAGAAFPPDLAEFLMDCLPVGSTNPRRPPELGPQFPDWRNNAAAAMRDWREFVLDGFIFDVEENDVWPEMWGAKPDDPRDARARVIEILDDAPRLIPIYAHRGVPNEPLEAGNPVFSVYQTDIIIYGRDLEAYLLNEFVRRPAYEPESRESFREIRFWSPWAFGDFDEELDGESA